MRANLKHHLRVETTAETVVDNGRAPVGAQKIPEKIPEKVPSGE